MTYYAPGTYDCQIVDQGFDVSKEKKTPFLWLSFQPAALVNLDGSTVDCTEHYDREVRMYLTEKTVERHIQRLRDIGFTGSSFKDLEPGGTCNLAEKVASIECKHEDGYERWDFPAPSGGGLSSEHKDGVARKLDALFGKALKGSASQAPVTEPEPDSGDIPF